MAYPVAMPGEPISESQALIDSFAMAPHPEGGWYAETYRAPAAPGERAAVTAIYFLLQKGQRSHWHSVDACEIWLWHAGAPLLLHVSETGGPVETILLGAKIGEDERPQAVVPTGAWQAAESIGEWTLVSCVVAPGFDYRGFTIAPPGWSPGAG